MQSFNLLWRWQGEWDLLRWRNLRKDSVWGTAPSSSWSQPHKGTQAFSPGQGGAHERQLYVCGNANTLIQTGLYNGTLRQSWVAALVAAQGGRLCFVLPLRASVLEGEESSTCEALPFSSSLSQNLLSLCDGVDPKRCQ